MNTPKIIFALLGAATLAFAACAPAATPGPRAGGAAAQPTFVPAATEAPAMVATDGSGLAALVPPGADRMIIKDATLALEVTSLTTAVSSMTQLAADQGGYMLETSTSGFDEHQTASLRMAVPAARFEATLERLRQLSSKVISEQGAGQDVSADYVDLQTRLANLEATSARVREFLQEAKTVEESLNVNAELSRLEGEIAQIKGQMKYYEGRSAFSTIAVSLTQVAAAVEPTPTAVWDPNRSMERATSTAGRLSQGLIDVFIYVGIGLAPLWVPGLAVVAFLIWLGRRNIRTARPKPEAPAKPS